MFGKDEPVKDLILIKIDFDGCLIVLFLGYSERITARLIEFNCADKTLIPHANNDQHPADLGCHVKTASARVTIELTKEQHMESISNWSLVVVRADTMRTRGPNW